MKLILLSKKDNSHQVPESLWNNPNVFNKKISDSQIHLMQTPVSLLLKNSQKALKKQNNKAAAWVCIVLGNPDAGINELSQAAKQLKLSALEIFSLSLPLGKLDLALKITNTDELKEVIVDVYAKAAACGSLEGLIALEKMAPEAKNDMISATHYRPFQWAALHGHLAILQHFNDALPEHVWAMIEANHFAAFKYATANGHLEVVNFIMDKTSAQSLNMLQLDNYEVFSQAAQNGHTSVMRDFVEKFPKFKDLMIRGDGTYPAFRWAAHHGRLDVLKYLVCLAPNLIEEMVTANNFDALRISAARGKTSVVEYLIQLSPELVPAMINAQNYEASRNAAKNGHHAIAGLLMSQIPTLKLTRKGTEYQVDEKKKIFSGLLPRFGLFCYVSSSTTDTQDIKFDSRANMRA